MVSERLRERTLFGGGGRVPGVLVLAALVATGAAAQWEALGPGGGRATRVLADPGGSSVWVGTEGTGVMRSLDGGVSWELLPGSIALSGREIVDLDRGEEGLVYALPFGEPGLRSADGGISWTALAPLPPRPPDEFSLPPDTLTVDPFAPGGLWAASSYSGLYHSLDRGTTWSRLADLPSGDPLVTPPFREVAVEPATGTLWLASQGVFRSADGGQSWQERSNGIVGFARSVWTIEILDTSPQVLLAGTFLGIHRSIDDGQSWTPVGPSGSVAQISAEPGHPERVVAVVEGRVFRSSDAGATWQPSGSGIPQSGIGSAVATDSGYFAGGVDGVHRSDDAGASWVAAGELPGFETYSLSAHPTALDPLLVGSPHGLLRRASSSSPWEPVRSGYATAVKRVATMPSTAYSLANGTIRRSDDDGATWGSSLLDAPSGYYLAGLWVDPSDASVVYAARTFDIGFGSHSTTVYRSLDGGSSWEPIWGASYNDPRELVVDPYQPEHLLLLPYSGQLLRSEDRGDTWSSPTGLPPTVSEIAADPAHPGRFVAFATGVGLFFSSDGGATWSPSGADLPALGWLSLIFHPTVPDRVFAVGDHRVFASFDGGVSWSSIGDEIEPLEPASLAAAGELVLVGTRAGVWQLDLSTAPCVPAGATLCLAGGRFEARVRWADFSGGAGTGYSHPLTGDTGGFWFFRPGNLELAVKVLDGTTLNGHWWVFYGSLSNVGFVLTVRDTETGELRRYENPAGTLASRGDTGAFPAAGSTGSIAATSWSGIGEAGSTGLLMLPATEPSPAASSTIAPCLADSTHLCLAGDRFSVTVDWEDFRGGSGAGTTVPLTGDSGAFWFFRPGNLELFVKLLDGRPVNGHWWVFYGALTNVPFTLEVTDSGDGSLQRYENQGGTFASRADTSAF